MSAFPQEGGSFMRRLLTALIAVTAFLAAASPAAASPVFHLKVNQQLPLAGFQVDVPCTGDTITFTQGWLHDTFYLTDNGSHFSLTTHDQPHNLKGTDTSGRSYEGVGITRQHFGGSDTGNQSVFTYVNNFFMIGKGGAPSLKTKEITHVTVRPDGTLSVAHDKLRITCG
jgi:hypothetical protein